MTPRDDPRYRVVVLAPVGRDAELATSLLAREGVQAAACPGVAELHAALGEQAGAALIAEEALSDGGLDLLCRWVGSQPSWSDFPFLVLTGGGGSTDRTVKAWERLSKLGNITLLERPLRSATLVSAVSAALRARRRQYEIAEYIGQCQDERRSAESARVELERSNSELQQFAYIASHDLREPLRTIGTFTQLLARRCQPVMNGQGEELVGHILGAVRRMSDLLSDLLAFSWAGQTMTPLENPSSADEILQNVIGTLHTAIEESGATIVHKPLPPVWMHESHVSEVLQNLLSNAIKYRGADPPRIAISSEIVGNHWRFAVSDNGIGIPGEYADRIFRLFQRLHGRDIPGTGLGLAICKKIVETYGGNIWVEPGETGGSTFYFTVPTSPSNPQREAQAVQQGAEND
jgi:signal transduction histidine kinase